MMGQKLVDETADCGSFFDHVDELLNFAVEDVEASLPPSNGDSFTSLWPMQSESIPCSDSAFSSNADLSAELSVPYEHIVQLEWLSAFVEDSFSGQSLMINKLDSPMTDSRDPSCHRFITSSPVSVLDSSSSCSGSSEKPESATPKGSPCARARSKRPCPATFCPATFSPRPPIQILPPPGGATIELGIASPEKVKVPNKKIKLAAGPLGPNESVGPVRKCLHCEVTKTPQWRAGPMGPKTLCNACGVRYKSGRLFPEYRPAVSPTFVPTLHSNSHRKVLKMRSKGDADLGTASIPK